MRLNDYILGLISLGSTAADKALSILFILSMRNWNPRSLPNERLLIAFIVMDAVIYFLATMWTRCTKFHSWIMEFLHKDTHWCFEELLTGPIAIFREEKCFRCENKNKYVRPVYIVLAFLGALPFALLSFVFGIVLIMPWLCLCFAIFLVHTIINLIVSSLMWIGLLHVLPHSIGTSLILSANNSETEDQDRRKFLLILKRLTLISLISSAIPSLMFRVSELAATRNWGPVEIIGIIWGVINVLVQFYVTNWWTYYIRLGISRMNVIYESRDHQPVAI